MSLMRAPRFETLVTMARIHTGGACRAGGPTEGFPVVERREMKPARGPASSASRASASVGQVRDPHMADAARVRCSAHPSVVPRGSKRSTPREPFRPAWGWQPTAGIAVTRRDCSPLGGFGHPQWICGPPRDPRARRATRVPAAQPVWPPRNPCGRRATRVAAAQPVWHGDSPAQNKDEPRNKMNPAGRRVHHVLLGRRCCEEVRRTQKNAAYT